MAVLLSFVFLSKNSRGNIPGIIISRILLANEQQKKDGRLIPITPHTAEALNTADMEFLRRENQLLKIITADTCDNEDERNRKVNYYARSALPICEIEEAYSKIKAINKRTAARVNRHTASGVQYRGPEVGADGLTQLQRDLKILENDF
jgi:hypothetical protein